MVRSSWQDYIGLPDLDSIAQCSHWYRGFHANCDCIQELLSDRHMTRVASFTEPELTDDTPSVMLLQHCTIHHL